MILDLPLLKVEFETEVKLYKTWSSLITQIPKFCLKFVCS